MRARLNGHRKTGVRMQELWRGNANAWECDELGHFNVRYYIARAMQAVGALSDRIGMRRAFGPEATATLIARDLHVRFLAEARPGAPLMIEGGVSEVGESGLTVVLIMRHAARGKVAASFQIRLDHADPRSARPFPWPARLREAIEALITDVPGEARPRGIEPRAPAPAISLKRADALGLAAPGLGRFLPEDVDVFGRMKAECAIAKISDSVIHFADGFPEQWENHASGAPLRHASALLELRIVYRGYAEAGDGYVVRSGVTAASEKVRSLVHWVFDPATGQPLWSAEGVGCTMDLETRKLAPASAETLERLKGAVKRELTI